MPVLTDYDDLNDGDTLTYWYDRREREWVLQVRKGGQHGDTLGNAVRVGWGRDGALIEAGRLAGRHDLTVVAI